MRPGNERTLTATPPLKIRADIPILASIPYLNSASCSPVPTAVLQAMSEYYATTPVNYRSGHTPFEQEVTRRVDAVRDLVASYIGASSPDEVVFTKNTTEGINVIAAGLDWSPGDEIVVTPFEHQSNLIPWMRLARRSGAVLRYVPTDRHGRVDPEDLQTVLTDKTRLVAIHHVSNLLGTIQDIPALSKVVHQRDSLLLVDAAQSEGRIDVDVATLGCDFLASCARKALMGPQGIGFLWGRRELLSSLQPLAIGGQAAQAVNVDVYRELDPPFRHEAGILNTAGVIGLGAALEFANDIGIKETRSYVIKLTDYLVGELADIDGVKIYSPVDSDVQAGIISWNLEGWEPLRVAERMYETRQIVVASGTCGSPVAAQALGLDGVVRSSLHHFNNIDDVNELASTLRALARSGN